MILTIVNIVFAALCVYVVRFAWLRMRFFLPVGWTRIDSEVKKGRYRVDVESRRAISEASYLLLAGIVWLLIGIAALGGVIYFGLQAIPT